LIASQRVEDFVFGDSVQPARRVFGHLTAPRLQCIQQRGLHHVLDEVEVAPSEDARQHRNQSRRFVAEKMLHERRDGQRASSWPRVAGLLA